ncbi:50S ribosomal protein L21 [Candidatus Saccharibacteria bacterium]|jgi:ribosomal protein L21|nr:MAG: 50S ribosomal protein L21 [Candidatus Saccharibacteria bacterium]
MKKAVIKLGASQFIVSEGDTVTAVMDVADEKKVSVDCVCLIDGDKTTFGGGKVELSVEDNAVRGDKVTAVRYKAKKRVMKVRGHKQAKVELKVTKIA